MKSFVTVSVLITGVLLSSACSNKKASTSEFEKAFPPAAATAPPKPAEANVGMLTGTFSSDQVVATASQDAVDALKNDDLPRAAGALLVLRQQTSLTPDQWIAAQNMMGNVQSTLAERAARGDAAAIRALEDIRRNKRR